MREKICCFTGHRHIPEKDYALIEEKLEQTIIMVLLTIALGVLWDLMPSQPKQSYACGMAACKICG